VKWGIIDRNPVKEQIKKLPVPRRERYVEDWELEAALSVASPTLHAYVILILLTGPRRGDLLRLRPTDRREDGIHVQPHKTAKSTGTRLIFEWSPALHEAVDAAKAARTKVIGLTLFSTREGKPYVDDSGFANGFDSLWRRFMDKAIRDTSFQNRFTEKDLRKKVERY